MPQETEYNMTDLLKVLSWLNKTMKFSGDEATIQQARIPFAYCDCNFTLPSFILVLTIRVHEVVRHYEVLC